MNHFVLHRFYSEAATYGVLVYHKTRIPFAVTLELPWIENKSNISCIPEGFYNCKRIISPSHGDVMTILGVPNRDHILFHKGNITKDTEGCILIGEQFEPVMGENGIIHSGKGYGEFMEILKDDERCTIQIRS